MKKLQIPVPDTDIQTLHSGDTVLLSGTLITGRDVAHKYIYSTLIKEQPAGGDTEVLQRLQELLPGSFIYHCGPIMASRQEGWEFLAGGPTTSIREEPYQAEIIRYFGLKGIIGKGGMGPATLQALQDNQAVYLHAVGGAAVVAASSVKAVKDVIKLEFGMPEAMWVLEVEDFPAVVTMDAAGNSMHADIESASRERLSELLG